MWRGGKSNFAGVWEEEEVFFFFVVLFVCVWGWVRATGGRARCWKGGKAEIEIVIEDKNILIYFIQFVGNTSDSSLLTTNL